MPSEVFVAASAYRGMRQIYNYIADTDSPEKADRLLDRLESAISSLAEFPTRGPYVKELLDLGIKKYREICYKPYRIIYRVIDNKVYVELVADGRRDMRKLLEQRLLEA